MNDKKAIIEQLNSTKKQLLNGSVYAGMVNLKNLYYTELEMPNREDFFAIKDMFKFMIEYFAKDTPDTERENVYLKIQKDLLSHTNRLIEFYKAYQVTNSLNIYSQYHQKVDYLHILKNFETESDKIDDVFMQIWLSNDCSVEAQNTIREFIDNDSIPEFNVSIITSAITLSLFRVFDYSKLLLLFEIYQKQYGESSIRALVGIIFVIFIHEDTVKLYPEIAEKLKKIGEIDDNSKNFEFVFLQFIRSKETENIIKEFNSDILPQMKKMQNNMFENIDFENFSSENMMDDENPGWENYFDKNPGFFEKMEKFTMRQFDGSDIFSATLGNLKNFPFFKKASNWFTPFSSENHEVIDEINDKLGENTLSEFLVAFENASYFCNSDKYSFCLHIPDIAPAMRDAAVKMLIAEIEGTQDMLNEKDGENSFDVNKSYIIRYIQDLYRFFHFNNNFNGFDNIFKMNVGVQNSEIFKEIENYSGMVRSCAELSFSQKFFNDAIALFEKAIQFGENEADIYEKTGFSYQKTKNFVKALENYKKAELFDQNKKWLFKKIGFSLIKMNNYEEALEYYQKAEKEDPEDLGTLMFIGRCYLALENYEEAQKNYFKVDFFDAENPKVMRSIALCYLKLDKYEQSEKYLQKVIEVDPTNFDFLNLGNLFWIKNEKVEAISFYVTALNEYKKFEDFKRDFNENKYIIKKHSIQDFDIQLMLDYLLMKFYQN